VPDDVATGDGADRIEVSDWRYCNPTTRTPAAQAAASGQAKARIAECRAGVVA